LELSKEEVALKTKQNALRLFKEFSYEL